MSGGRLPKQVVFGNLEGAVQKGRGWKDKEWTDCVQNGRHPKIWNSGGLGNDGVGAEVWVETDTDGGRRFMATCRK